MPRNSSVNLDITNNAVGATIGGGTTERSISWLGTADMSFSQNGTSAATYNLPDLTSGPSASTTDDTLLGYSSYNTQGCLLYGGTPVGGSNVPPFVLSAGSTGQVLQVGPTAGSLQWGSVASTNWIAATATQIGVAGTGYYVPTGVGCTFTMPSVAAAGTYLALYASGPGANWTISLSGQSIQLGSMTVSNSLTSNASGDGVWMICTTADTNWLVISSMGNISYT